MFTVLGIEICDKDVILCFQFQWSINGSNQSNSVINNNQIMIFLTVFDLKDVKRAMPRNFNENQFKHDCNHDF